MRCLQCYDLLWSSLFGFLCRALVCTRHQILPHLPHFEQLLSHPVCCSLRGHSTSTFRRCRTGFAIISSKRVLFLMICCCCTFHRAALDPWLQECYIYSNYLVLIIGLWSMKEKNSQEPLQFVCKVQLSHSDNWLFVSLSIFTPVHPCICPPQALILCILCRFPNTSHLHLWKPPWNVV